MQSAEWIYRDAKLIEAGVYPDKGVVITEAQLEGLVRSFRAPAPILVEHRPSPLLLGWLVRLWRRGDALYGRLALFPEADALLRRLRLRGLSVGLSRDLRRLLEVSITASPRIPSAQLFHSAQGVCSVGVPAEGYGSVARRYDSVPADGIEALRGVPVDGYKRGANAFRTDTVEVIRLETVEIRESSAGTPTLRHDESVGETPTLQPTRGEVSFVGETPTLPPTTGTPSYQEAMHCVNEMPTLQPTAGTPSYQEVLESRVRELEAELRRREAREQIQQWSLRGQLPPALAPLAEAILLQGDAPVQFSGATTSLAELFRQFVNSLPPHHLLGELAPTPETEPHGFSADALEFLRRAFPDMNPAEILQKEAQSPCLR